MLPTILIRTSVNMYMYFVRNQWSNNKINTYNMNSVNTYLICLPILKAYEDAVNLFEVILRGFI